MSSISGKFLLDGDASFAGTTFTHTGTGCVIAADARIDYRGDNGRDCAKLILERYLDRREACLDELLGDFAFVIWDPRERKLFCARDHFGMRPFYYHHAPNKCFVFASDARDIFNVPDVPYAINQGRMADFLVPELQWINYDCTFFEGVYRLPPGHKLVVTPDKLEVFEYSRPAPGPSLPNMSDSEYVEGFMEVFTRAVEQRLRGPAEKVGAMLSGGMDSGSVAAVATSLLKASCSGPLRTVSAARERGIDCDESQRIYASIDMLAAQSTIVSPEDVIALSEQLLANMAEPFDGEFLFMKAIYHAASTEGLDALLDGGAGDLVLSEGSHILRLLRRGRVAPAFHEVLAAPKFWGDASAMPELLRYPLRLLLPEAVKRTVRPYRRRVQARDFVARSLISSEFANAVDIEARCEHMWRTFPGDWIADPAEERVAKIRPNVCAGRERYGRLAASEGIEASDPFLDLNVVAYCSQLPGKMLLRDGWPKYVLREAMAGRLPESVLWGRGKPHIGWVYNDLLIKREISLGRLTLDGLEIALSAYVDVWKLTRAWQEFETGGDSERIYSAYILARWLEENGTRPVVSDQGFR